MQFDTHTLHSIRLRLELKRCYTCGKFRAVEPNYSESCPYCVHIELDRLNNKYRHLERSNTSLRGALTKASRKLAAMRRAVNGHR